MPSVARGLRLIEVNAPSRSSPTPSGRSGMTPGFGACGWLGHGPYRDCPGPDWPDPRWPCPPGVPYPPEAPYPPAAPYPPGAPGPSAGWSAPSPGGWPGSYGGGAYPPGSPAGGNQGRGGVPPSPSPALLVPGGTLSVIFLLTGTACASAGPAPRWRPYSHEAPGGETALRPLQDRRFPCVGRSQIRPEPPDDAHSGCGHPRAAVAGPAGRASGRAAGPDQAAG